MTVSHLRFGPEKINAPYCIEQADYLAVHVAPYMQVCMLAKSVWLLRHGWAGQGRALPAAPSSLLHKSVASSWTTPLPQSLCSGPVPVVDSDTAVSLTMF